MEGTQPGKPHMLKLTLPRFPTAAIFLNAPNTYQPSWEPGIETRQWKHHILRESLVASRVGYISASCWGAHRQLHPIQVPFPQNTPQPRLCQSRIFFSKLKILELILITKWNAKWLRSAERLWHSRQLTFNWHHGSILHLCISKLGCEDISGWSCCDSFNWIFHGFGTSWCLNMLMNMPMPQLLRSFTSNKTKAQEYQLMRQT